MITYVVIRCRIFFFHSFVPQFLLNAFHSIHSFISFIIIDMKWMMKTKTQNSYHCRSLKLWLRHSAILHPVLQFFCLFVCSFLSLIELKNTSIYDTHTHTHTMNLLFNHSRSTDYDDPMNEWIGSFYFVFVFLFLYSLSLSRSL